MHCEKFKTQLNQYLDERVDPAAVKSSCAEMADHAQSCQQCSEILVACEALFDGLDLLAVPKLQEEGGEDDFASDVLAKLKTSRSKTWPVLRIAGIAQWPTAIQLTAAAALAASVLLVVLLNYPFGKPENNTPGPMAKPEKTIQPQSPNREEIQKKKTNKESSNDVPKQNHLARQDRGSLNWVTQFNDLPLEEQKQWVAQMVNRLEPLANPMANSMAMTYKAVIQTIPTTFESVP